MLGMLQVISFYFEYLAREKYTDTNFGFVGGCLASFLINAGLHLHLLLQLLMLLASAHTNCCAN